MSNDTITRTSYSHTFRMAGATIMVAANKRAPERIVTVTIDGVAADYSLEQLRPRPGQGAEVEAVWAEIRRCASRIISRAACRSVGYARITHDGEVLSLGHGWPGTNRHPHNGSRNVRIAPWLMTTSAFGRRLQVGDVVEVVGCPDGLPRAEHITQREAA